MAASSAAPSGAATPSAAASSAAAAPAKAPPVDPVGVVSALGAKCADDGDVALHVSPALPAPGRPLRVFAVTVRGAPPDGIIAAPATGSPSNVEATTLWGPPASLHAELGSIAEGKLRIVAHRAGAPVACTEVPIAERPPAVRVAFGRSAWPVVRAWDRRAEDLYSAWVEKLFDAPIDAQPSFGALHELTRDPARNFLHDHLALGEDGPSPTGLRLDPDCADLPYFLRAYFSFKLGLPFGFSSCTRGGRGQAPRCLSRGSNLEQAEDPARDRIRRLEGFLRVRLKDTVHSGTGRTLAADDFTDYYPIRLDPETLRPGAVYADPFGHVLVVAKRVPQAAGGAGALFAFDGQPDGTVAKKRFWRGNFLFAQDDPSMGSPGFKRFRPVVVQGSDVVPMKNADIASSASYGDFGLDQTGLDRAGFYDRMDDLLSPAPLEAERALLELVQALEEQVRTRVRSVDNGERHHAQNRAVIEMPDGAASIFETTGDWENFSTPSRDLRILIAIDVVAGFPALVARRPDRFVVPPGGDAAALTKALGERLASETTARKFSYTRSDGSAFELSLADVIARAPQLETAYDPNDCPEIRWGAPAGSDEARTCSRRAPADQRQKMEKFRRWFHDRKRPPRE